MRGQQLVGVEPAPETGHLGVDPRAPFRSGFELLQHQEGGAFPHDRARAVSVVGTAGTGAQVIPVRHDPQRVHLGHVPPGDRIVEATGERQIHFASTDGAVGGAHRNSPRLGGAREVRVGALQTERLRDEEERGRLQPFHVEEGIDGRTGLAEPVDVSDAVRTSSRQQSLLQVHQIADLFVAPDEEARTLQVYPGEVQLRVAHGQRGADEGELVRPGHHAERFTMGHELFRREVSDLATNLSPQGGGVVAANRANTTPSGDQPVPRRLGANAQWGHQTDPRDHHPPHGAAPASAGTRRIARAVVTS